MRLSTATVAALSPLALAAPINISGASGTADIIVRRNMGGVAGDHSDTRILVPLGHVFAGHPSLDAVSTLWLNAAYGADVAAITCTPFKNTDGTGEAGASFSKEHPSYVSTNNDKIGSIFCS